MPVSVDNIFSESIRRHEFRVEDVANQSVDEVILGNFEAAAAWVGQECGVPVLNETKELRCHSPGASEPLTLFDTYVQSVERVRYWNAQGHLYEEPNATVTVGRLVTKSTRPSLLWPGADGWPSSILSGSWLEVSYTRGVTVVPRGLRGAIILVAYDLFLGKEEIKPTASVYALIGPYRVYR